MICFECDTQTACQIPFQVFFPPYLVFFSSFQIIPKFSLPDIQYICNKPSRMGKCTIWQATHWLAQDEFKGAKFSLLDFNAQNWQCRDISSSKSNYRLSVCVVLLLLVYCPGSSQRHVNACKSPPPPLPCLRNCSADDFCHSVSKQQIAANGHPSMQMIAHSNGCFNCDLQEKQYDTKETPRVVSSILQCCIHNSSLNSLQEVKFPICP